VTTLVSASETATAMSSHWRCEAPQARAKLTTTRRSSPMLCGYAGRRSTQVPWMRNRHPLQVAGVRASHPPPRTDHARRTGCDGSAELARVYVVSLTPSRARSRGAWERCSPACWRRRQICRRGLTPCSAKRRSDTNCAGVSGALRRSARASARVSAGEASPLWDVSRSCALALRHRRLSVAGARRRPHSVARGPDGWHKRIRRAAG
jgi:hypothetical protein